MVPLTFVVLKPVPLLRPRASRRLRSSTTHAAKGQFACRGHVGTRKDYFRASSERVQVACPPWCTKAQTFERLRRVRAHTHRFSSEECVHDGCFWSREHKGHVQGGGARPRTCRRANKACCRPHLKREKIVGPHLKRRFHGPHLKRSSPQKWPHLKRPTIWPAPPKANENVSGPT